MALSKPKKIARRAGPIINYRFGVKSLVTIFQGALVILASGYLRPGRGGQGADNAAKAVDAATYQVAGIALDTVTGGAADGDVQLDVETGEWPFKNAGADPVTASDIGKLVYIVDDETVGRTSPNSTLAAAGRMTGLDSDGTVWVRVGVGMAV